MSEVRITDIHAIEILDSRARPTLSVTVTLSDGTRSTAGVPSGASTGSAEAVELRDGDGSRFGGGGVLTALGHINGVLARTLAGQELAEPGQIDTILQETDGTPDKSRLGANAIVGISMAVWRAWADSTGRSLWQVLRVPGWEPKLPVPHFNVINGGAHAANPLDFQEFMLAPLGVSGFAEAIRAGAEVYAALRSTLGSRGYSTGLGDEGGFAPDIAEPEEVLELLVEAIEIAGYPAGPSGVAIAMDPAASGFYRDGRYHVAGKVLSFEGLIDRYEQLITDFPVWSIEDGLAEDDDEGWLAMTAALGRRVQIVGDDNFVTNPALISAAIGRGIANAALIKVNQIGTVAETLAAMRVCREAGYGAMVSHRSGETDDTFIADLAVGSGCGQLKSGAPARGERVAKYNRLLRIADEYPDLPYAGAVLTGRAAAL